MTNANIEGKTKPLNLRIIFVLNAFKILLSVGLYIGFKYQGLTIGTLSSASGAAIILYTTIGYLITFTVMVFSILKRNMLGLRLAIGADFLVSIPAKAFIGMLIATVSLGLTFTVTVKRYFAWRNNGGNVG